MARSTGPILAVGAISFGNQWLLSPAHDLDFKILVGTAVAAGVLAGLEQVQPTLAVGIAYIALVTILFTRVNGRPAPAENLLTVTGLGKKPL